MKKMLFAIILFVMGMLFSSTAIAHEGEDHGKEKHEEGSGGSSMDMGHKSDGHEYKGEHDGDHSKEHYEKHEKKEEGSGMKEDAHKMQEEHHEKKEEGSR